MLPAILALPLLLAGARPPHTASIAVEIAGLRSATGVIRACLTQEPSAFPDCREDPEARRLTIAAGGPAAMTFAAVPAGRYAIALMHDENRNGRVDMALVVPREGFGFSRNPALRLGSPPFATAAFTVAGEPVVQTIRMRYLF